MHTQYCARCIVERVQSALCGLAFHSQKPLMVIHHLDDCPHSQGTHSTPPLLDRK